jgi:hypothetical protein
VLPGSILENTEPSKEEQLVAALLEKSEYVNISPGLSEAIPCAALWDYNPVEFSVAKLMDLVAYVIAEIQDKHGEPKPLTASEIATYIFRGKNTKERASLRDRISKTAAHDPRFERILQSPKKPALFRLSAQKV